MHKNDWVEVGAYPNRSQASEAKESLDIEGIDAQIRSELPEDHSSHDEGEFKLFVRFKDLHESQALLGLNENSPAYTS